MGDDNVVVLPVLPMRAPPDADGPPPPQFEVIELLEKYLEEARSGKLQSVAVAGVRDGHVLTDGAEVGTGPYAHDLLAAIMLLQHRYLACQLQTFQPDAG